LPPSNFLLAMVESPIMKIVIAGLSALKAEKRKKVTKSNANLFFIFLHIMVYTAILQRNIRLEVQKQV